MGKDRIGDQARPFTPLGPAEQAFLQSCARLENLPEPQSSALDWKSLTIRMVSDGIAPLAYQQVKDRPEAIPPEPFAAFKKNYYQNASANHIRLEELKRIGRCLALKNIPLLVLKGGALAQTAYQDPALRFMGDLDVAVPPDQTKSALAILQAEGFEMQGDWPEEEGGLLTESGWHLIMTKSLWGKELLLEFHWPLRRQVLVSQLAVMDIQHLWETAVPLDQENNLWQPSPPMMCLHLCLHTGLQHRFTDLGLRHYVDLDRLVRLVGDEPGFWPAFAALARQSGAQHVSFFCLSLTASLLDTPIPAGALTPLQPAGWKQRLFARSLTKNDILNRRRALYGPPLRGGRRWRWRVLTADRLWNLWGAPLKSLFPGRTYLSSYYATNDRRRLAGYTLWYPFHALSRALRRRYRKRFQQPQKVQGMV